MRFRLCGSATFDGFLAKSWLSEGHGDGLQHPGEVCETTEDGRDFASLRRGGTFQLERGLVNTQKPGFEPCGGAVEAPERPRKRVLPEPAHGSRGVLAQMVELGSL